jgi:upstream activation factor subunit UAF30
MPRTSKPKTTTEVVETPVTTQNVAPVTTTTKTTTSKQSKPKAVKEVKTVETSVPSEVVSQNVSEEIVPEVVDIEASVAAQSVEFLAKLNQLSVIISSLKNEYKTLEKKWTRELKVAQKVNSKRKRKVGNRTPSGFVKPTKISDELANFLEKPLGAEMARTDVTREINKYIRAHNLQDKENGRKINPDTKLSSLLKLKKTDELTYFNLQKYMSPHFAKSGKDVVEVA